MRVHSVTPLSHASLGVHRRSIDWRAPQSFAAHDVLHRRRNRFARLKIEMGEKLRVVLVR
jgi:hypothetical protein